MIVKFKTGASAYGLGYVEGEVAELDKLKARVLTTLVDTQGNVRGQDWRDKDVDVEDLLAKGVCVPATKDEIDAYQAKIKAEKAEAAKAAAAK